MRSAAAPRLTRRQIFTSVLDELLRVDVAVFCAEAPKHAYYNCDEGTCKLLVML